MYLRKYFWRKAFLILFSIFSIGIVGGIVIMEFENVKTVEPAQATYFDITTGTGDNMNGFAWSHNFGWISFNSTDCDLNGDGVFGDSGAPAGCPDASVDFYDYGVNIEPGVGQLSGFAWSYNLGWIYFGPDAVLGSFGNTSAADAPLAPLQWATYNYGTTEVEGWAKALSLGDNGWISFSGAWANDVTIDYNTSEVHGFAWNGNDTGDSIGWISFNCEDSPNTCTGGSNPGTLCPNNNECLGGGTCASSCSVSDYKVYGIVNRAPEAIELEAPFLSHQDLCDLGITNAILKWDFEDVDPGAYETAYQIVFDDDDDPSIPLFDTGKCDATSTNLSCQIAPGVGRYPIHNILDLDYDGHYYWWVKVWDEFDAESQWATSTDWFADFIIPGHELPVASVDNFKPTMPSAGEEIHFEGSSSIYEYAAPSAPIPCTNDGINCTWNWHAAPAYYATINDPATTSPTIILDNSEQAFAITLSVTDKDGFTCTSTPLEIFPEIELPTWVEIKTDE